MLGFIKEMFVVLLSSIVSASNHTKCVSLSNKKCGVQPTLISLHPNEYSQEFDCYPFAVKLHRCFRNCNTLIYFSHKVCIPNKTEDLNLSVFNMIRGINESKALTKHLLCECKCECKKIDVHDVIDVHVNWCNWCILLHVFAKMENI